jgi:hypothetical protein
MSRNYKGPIPPGIGAPNLHLEVFTPNQALEILQADLISESSNLYPNASYKYLIPGKPRPFMRLGKFQASHIHQMRSSQSYLAAQPTYNKRDNNTICPAYQSEEETFEHAALEYPAREPLRQVHCPGLSSVSPQQLPLVLPLAIATIFSRYFTFTYKFS